MIPALVSREALAAPDLVEAFRRTVSTFEGSVAIGAASAAEPGQVLLALRGSGQGLYVGLAEDLTIVASEPYGLVEVTDRYLRMDGETPAHAGPAAERRPGRRRSRPTRAGELEGIVRLGLRRHAAARHEPTSWRRPRSRPATSTAATPPTSC